MYYTKHICITCFPSNFRGRTLAIPMLSAYQNHSPYGYSSDSSLKQCLVLTFTLGITYTDYNKTRLSDTEIQKLWRAWPPFVWICPFPPNFIRKSNSYYHTKITLIWFQKEPKVWPRHPHKQHCSKSYLPKQ